ncbi:MAG: MFS transporter, partial [Chloroflexi bacterium]|nr:MFS transporter [Chloroflexota bacterium]
TMYWNTAFALAISILFPVVAKDILFLGPSGLGYMWMAQGIGSLMGAAWAASRGSADGQGRYIIGGSIALGLSVIGVGLSAWAPLTFFLLWATGIGGSSASVGIRTAIQLMVPDDFRGRVMSLWGMTHTAVRPLGEMQFGAIAAVAGAPFALALGGAAVLVFVAVVVIPNKRMRALRVTA